MKSCLRLICTHALFLVLFFVMCIGCVHAPKMNSAEEKSAGFPELTFMLPINIGKEACLGSMVAQPTERCISWTTREVASPLYLKSRQQVIVGGLSGYLQAIDLKNRKTLRSKKLNGNLVAKPAFLAGNLYFALDSGVVQSLQADNFAPLWQQSVDSGVAAPVLIDNDKLIVVTDSASIYAFNLHDGKLLWVTKRPHDKSISLPYFGRPLVMEIKSGLKQGRFAVYGHPSGRVDFIDIENGKIEFDVQVGTSSAPFADVVAAPILFNGMVIAAGYNSGIVAIDPVSRAKLWSIEEKGISRFALAGDQIIAAGPKKVVSVKKENVAWRFDFLRGEPTSLVVNGSLIYFGADEDGFMVLDRISGRPLKYAGSRMGFAGELEWSNEDKLLFATSTAGFLYVMDANFAGVVQRQGYRYGTI